MSASISAFSSSAAFVKSAFAFSFALSNAFSASVFASTVLDAGSSLCDLSEYVTVTFPVLSTEIWLSVKFVFAFLTASFTAVVSASDKLLTSLTFTFSGSFNGDFAASVPSTGTSISFETPSRVTVTLTYVLPSFSVIFPYITVSVSLSASPFAVTLAFTVPLSVSDNSAPTLGSTEIFAAPSVTAKVKSSTFPDKAVRASCNLAKASSTSGCVASCLAYTSLAFAKASS